MNPKRIDTSICVDTIRIYDYDELSNLDNKRIHVGAHFIFSSFSKIQIVYGNFY